MPNDQNPSEEQRTLRTDERSLISKTYDNVRNVRTYGRTVEDEQMDILIEVLRDESPNRAIYYRTIKRLGFDDLHTKAVELSADPTVRKPSAVFFYWVKKQPDRAYTPDLYVGKDGLQHDSVSHDVVLRAEDFDLNDPLKGWD